MGVRFDGSTDELRRTANLPGAGGDWTLLGRFKQSVNRGADSTLFAMERVGIDGDYLYFSAANALSIFGAGADATFSSSPSVGSGFDLALKKSATTLTGYWKPVGSATWNTQTKAANAFTPDRLSIGNDSSSAWFNGVAASVRLWDRALTDSELLVESFYALPQFPASLNFWLPLFNASDVADRSGNGRNATSLGTLTTEDSSQRTWTSSPKLFIPAAAVAANPIPRIIHHLRNQRIA